MTKRNLLIVISIALLAVAGVVLYLQLRPRAPQTIEQTEGTPDDSDRRGGAMTAPDDG